MIQEPQTPVIEADWNELFRRKPETKAELNRIVNERVRTEMMQRRIEELEAEKSNGTGEITADFVEAK